MSVEFPPNRRAVHFPKSVSEKRNRNEQHRRDVQARKQRLKNCTWLLDWLGRSGNWLSLVSVQPMVGPTGRPFVLKFNTGEVVELIP